MYLNLDLLYNTYNYLFPLFYYQDNYSYIVYSPITKKSATKIYYCDHITLNFYWESPEPQVYPFKKENFIITETECISYGFKYIKCDPFKISKKGLEYLKSNIRIVPTT